MNIKISKLLTTTGVCGLIYLGMASNAIAESGMKHSVADFNQDGMVTSEELITYVQINFLKIEKNNDQMLDGSEWDDLWWNAEEH